MPIEKTRSPDGVEHQLQPRGEKDIGPDIGVRAPMNAPADDDIGAIGTGSGYSGQEFDSAGQAAWRAGQQRRAVPADGKVSDSGAGAGGGNPGEDFDVATPGGA
ncbi:hypothetical protein [Sphingomonas immobilis]|uniref:Uncharacterized protein n=1 Tax=Sphingomonas immobilis TaxID=3063997 RepID=A0ABT8ZWI1_9SPHN|nr:hypothetical protein [Sphingomonas sp. CA1-15]MDO7841935.1 hypothetical protein [Sphingomonas sp. CA1-15]